MALSRKDTKRVQKKLWITFFALFWRVDENLKSIPSFQGVSGRKMGQNGDNCQIMKDLIKNDVGFSRKTFIMTFVSLWITLWKLGISRFFLIFCVCVFKLKYAGHRFQN